MEASYSSLGSFITKHNQYLSYGSIIGYLNLALFITLTNKEDNHKYQAAMSGPNKTGFVAPIGKEIPTFMERNVYDRVKITLDMKINSGVWALQQKQFPDGLPKQLKAWFCARDSKQIEGVDYFETYHPVVMLMVVQLLLVMGIFLNLDTAQIGYTAAFVHAY